MLECLLHTSDDETSGPGDDSPRLDPARSPQLPFAQQDKQENAQHPQAQQEDAQQPAEAQPQTITELQDVPQQVVHPVQQQDAQQLVGELQASKPADAGTPPADGFDAEVGIGSSEMNTHGQLMGVCCWYIAPGWALSWSWQTCSWVWS